MKDLAAMTSMIQFGCVNDTPHHGPSVFRLHNKQINFMAHNIPIFLYP